ncbi:hypothetical protein OHW12_17590 [Acinetobacter baumannii]|nr:hypothetical protein [Acinetobacter baumannii]
MRISDLLKINKQELPESPKIDRDKYKALFEYQKSQYEDEKNRYQKLEDKSSKYLTLLTFVIPVYSLIINKFLDDKFNDVNCFLYSISLFFIFITFFSFCFAWYSIFKSLKLNENSKMPADSELVNFFNNEGHSLESIYLYLANHYATLITDFRAINSRKTDAMLKGYNEIKFSILCFAITMLLILLIKVV